MVVRVRKDGLKGYLDGELKMSYTSKDFTEFAPAPYRRVKDETTCYIGSYDPTVFYRVELVEVTGTGKALR